MNGRDMLEALNYVNYEYIAEAEDCRSRGGAKVLKWVSAAACVALCVIAIGNMGKNRAVYDGSVETGPRETEIIEQITREEPVAMQENYVNYIDLGLPQTEGIDFPNGEAAIDIAPFEESFLKECSAIVEGRVTNIYVKHYEYDVYDDKFEADGVLHMRCDTVVYELAVERTWYGDDLSGSTIKVEDSEYYRAANTCGEAFEIRQGMRYVLPLYEYGEHLHHLRNRAGGDDSRDSTLSTVYPFHPQIAVTEDGSYIVSSDWPTLINENALPIVIEDDGRYSDKMYLVDGESFTQQMEVLIERME